MESVYEYAELKRYARSATEVRGGGAGAVGGELVVRRGGGRVVK